MYWTISIKSREKNLQLKSSSQQQVVLVLIYQQLPVLAWLWCNRFLLHRKLLVVVPAGCRRVVDVYPITRCSLAQVPTARLLENTVASCVKRFAAGLSGGKRVLLSPAWKIPVRSEFIFSLIPQGDAMEPRVPIVPAVKNWPRPPQPVTFIQKEKTCAKAKKKVETSCDDEEDRNVQCAYCCSKGNMFYLGFCNQQNARASLSIV